MILDVDTNPKHSVYYIGAILIEYMEKSRFRVFDATSLFDELRRSYLGLASLSFEYYVLTLDWLFLVGVVELSIDGDLKYVSGEAKGTEK